MSGGSTFLEIRKLTPEWKQPLLTFLRSLEEVSNPDFFRPHPFTDGAVEEILHTTRNDLYYVLTEGSEVVGYGMLRGWDQGYAIPSLGIAIHPGLRGNGLGRMFMHFLAAAARGRGAEKIRLRVMAENGRALKLYESLGYMFKPEENELYLVGFLELHTDSPRTCK
jgi:[ribosomal protein S18]-alanine N-acetyltransferase